MNIILVGAAGHQGGEYYKLLNDKFRFVAAVDSNMELLNEVFCDTNMKLSKHLDDILYNVDFDAAIVCLPHNSHREITLPLLKTNKMIIKEKPLATSMTELFEYVEAMKEYKNYKLLTIVQRQFNNIFMQAYDHLPLLGKIYNFKYEYNLSVQTQTTGWRAEYDKSRGGVLIDMGYHVLDIIFTFFGRHQSIDCLKSYCYELMECNSLEDSASLIIKHLSGICGTINLSRHHSQKTEIFEIIGSEGTMTITPTSFKLFNRKGEIIGQSSGSNISNNSSIKLDMFQQYVEKFDDINFLRNHFDHHRNIVAAITDAYNSNKSSALNNALAA